MNGMPMGDGMDDEMDDPELRAKLMEELEQLVRGGQAREMSSRLRPEAPPEEGMDPNMEGAMLEGGEGEPIPGVEGEEGMEPEGGAGPDPAKLRALLASLKSKPTMG